MTSEMLADAGLVVFLRFPEKGKVKSRLAATVGEHIALEIYNRLITITLDLASRSGIPAYLFFDSRLPDIKDRDPAFTYLLQTEGNLGLKMKEALAFVLERHSKAIIIGSDCPLLTPSILQKSISVLKEEDLVLGPATDGGYYLLGCRRITASLFEDIPWSTPMVLDQTIEKIKMAGLSYRLLDLLTDIDTEEDWLRYVQTGS